MKIVFDTDLLKNRLLLFYVLDIYFITIYKEYTYELNIVCLILVRRYDGGFKIL